MFTGENERKQGKREETGCKIICGAPTTLAVKGQMMMMMMMMMMFCVAKKMTYLVSEQ